MTTENYENIHNFRQIDLAVSFKKISCYIGKKLDLNCHMFDGKFG